MRPKSSAGMKSGHSAGQTTSKSSLKPTNISVNNRQPATSAVATAKGGSRIETASIKGDSNKNKNNQSQMVMRSEDDSILDLKQIEEMMRASQKSNIFSAIPIESIENRYATAQREVNSSSHFSKLGMPPMPDSSDRMNIIPQVNLSTIS